VNDDGFPAWSLFLYGVSLFSPYSNRPLQNAKTGYRPFPHVSGRPY
jgi:hypothetical protein